MVLTAPKMRRGFPSHEPSRASNARVGLRLAVLVVRGIARASQLGRAADIDAGHATFQDVPQFSGGFVPFGTGDVQPHVRERSGGSDGALPLPFTDVCSNHRLNW